MVVKCDKCEAEFRIDERRVKPSGSKVRCSKCGHIFKVMRSDPTTAQHQHSQATEDINDNRTTPSAQQKESPPKPKETFEVLSGEGKFPSFKEKEVTVVYSPEEKNAYIDSGEKDSPYSITNGSTTSEDSEDAKEKDPQMLENPDEKKDWADVMDKERVRRAKPPAVKATIPARKEKQKEKGSAGGSGVGDEFDWDSLDMGDDIDLDNEPSKAQTPPTLSNEIKEDPILNSDEDENILQLGGSSPQTNDFDLDLDDNSDEEIKFELDRPPSLPQDEQAYKNPTEFDDFSDPTPNDSTPAPPRRSPKQRNDGKRTTLHHNAPASYAEQTIIDSSPSAVPQRPTKAPNYSTSVSRGSGLKKIISISIAVLVLGGVLIAGTMIASSLGIISKDKGAKITRLLSAIMPGGIGKPEKIEVVITDEKSHWLITKNGYMFVVSGLITNNSDYIINFIEIESEFRSGEEILFAQVAFAGNTFEDKDLQVMSIEKIENQLNRKNGDINFRNTDKLAGLNYGINPGDSVPYFSVFPSESRVLGLHYRVKVIGFEKGPLVRR